MDNSNNEQSDEEQEEIDQDSVEDYSDEESDSDKSDEESEKSKEEDNEEEDEFEDVPDDDSEIERMRTYEKEKQLKKLKKERKPLATFKNMFPRMTDSEFIKIIQKIAKAIEESMIEIPPEYLKEIFGNTGNSEEMAYRMFHSDMEVPFNIRRFVQGHQDILMNCKKLPTKQSLETWDLDSDNTVTYMDMYFTKEFK